MKTEYCCGFLFSEDGFHVALIRKDHPEWQAGKLNGVGGHIEIGETPLQAMRREFEEEAGVVIEDWINFAILEFSGGKVHFFRSFSPDVYNVKSNTSEIVEVYPVDKILADPGEIFATIDHIPTTLSLARNARLVCPTILKDKGNDKSNS